MQFKVMLLIILGLFVPYTAMAVQPSADTITTSLKHVDSAQLIPLRDFFKNPEQANFKVSRNAVYLAYLKPWNSRMNVFIQKLSAERLPVGPEKQLTFVKDRDIHSYMWKGDGTILYSKDSGGDENYHIYAIDVTSGNEKDITPFLNTKAGVQDDLNEVSETDVLIYTNQRNPEVFDIYRLNTKTGQVKMVAQNPGNVNAWLADHNGDIRVAYESDGLITKVYTRASGAAAFKKILEFEYTNECTPLLFTADNKFFYAASNLGRDKRAIVRIDPNNGKEVQMVYARHDVDVADLDYSQLRKVITEATFVTWKQEFHFFDKIAKERINNIKKHVGDMQVFITSHNKIEDLFTVFVTDDRTRGNVYLYDQTNDRITLLYDSSKLLPRDKLASMKPIEYKSRDGLTIHGYLTMPKGSIGKNLPVIVNPHGGPWMVRDKWEYNPEVQFLVNRGYAVLQVNYRGSNGYGKEFYKKSFKQWGRAMQDDITDGVKWLIAQGIADPRRIGIYGGSYGGYATLAGITFTPDLYACAVDLVGISNLFTFLNTLPPYWKSDAPRWVDRIGDPVKDRALLEAASPLFHVDKIKTPLFIAQGANDPRVKIAESNQIAEALRKRGVEVQYMVKENEGHGFYNEENRFEFYVEMEKFLAQHLQ